MDIVVADPAKLEDATVVEVVDLLNAVRCHDAPHQPPPTAAAYRRMLRHGWDGRGPEQLWLAHDDDSLVGHASVWMPHWDNKNLAFIEVDVRPDRRRQGIGTALLEETRQAAQSAGRSSLLGEAWSDSAGEAFLHRHGFTKAQLNVQRRLHLLTADSAQIDQLHDEAAAKAQGYEVVRLIGGAPADLREGLVELFSAINDAPTDDLDIEDDVFTAERLRCFEEAQTAMGQRLYRVLARCSADGVWAGHTVLTVDPSKPTWAGQGDTSVLRDHRGHRLGMLLKTEMIRWLREVEPQLEQIDTWNATSNTYMIAVNDALGCTVVAHMTEWQHKR